MSKGRFIAGWILSGLTGLLLLLDGVMKLFKPQFVVDANVGLGYPASVVVPLGVVLVLCTLLYLIPVTSILGAILLTGYLGGAVATHVRVGGPAFPIIFAATIGVLVWAGLYLRDPLISAVIPVRRSGEA